ncbi:MAG: hypothetical protein HZB29_02125 [Nitrospinae bacterium]|nr:hypothetical protein [Nitrospinota bacterium]
MKSSVATAEVFFTAFKALGASEREAFIEKMISDPAIREDLMDLALIEKAKKVKGKPVAAADYFQQRKGKRVA